VEEGVSELALEFRGALTEYPTNPLVVAYLKGFLTPILDIKVNFVNAPVLARERGIKVRESKTQEDENFTSLIAANVTAAKGASSVSGTVFAQKLPRIVSIDGLAVDISPAECMLLLTNDDRPGIVGQVGMVLGSNNINIAGMQVGRRSVGGEAVTVITVDTCVSADVLKKIGSLPGVTRVKYIAL
jgi:D-3-phosphoglycerate dehydrogenase